jgi:hypothetical protein
MAGSRDVASSLAFLSRGFRVDRLREMRGEFASDVIHLLLTDLWTISMAEQLEDPGAAQVRRQVNRPGDNVKVDVRETLRLTSQPGRAELKACTTLQ